jgi:response regulator NasT
VLKQWNAPIALNVRKSTAVDAAAPCRDVALQHGNAALRIAIVDDAEEPAAVLEPALREAGYSDIARIGIAGPWVAEIERASPDIIVFHLGSPTNEELDKLLTVTSAIGRPVAMFVDSSDEGMTARAVEAGVSAYVVNGLSRERVKAVLELAVSRFRALSALRKQLDEAKAALAERRIIDRAKLYLMSTRKLTEANAYALIRGTAMHQGKRIVEIAQALLTATELLEGKKDEAPKS